MSYLTLLLVAATACGGATTAHTSSRAMTPPDPTRLARARAGARAGARRARKRRSRSD